MSYRMSSIFTVTVSLFFEQYCVALLVTLYCVLVVGHAKGSLHVVQLKDVIPDPPGNADQVKAEPPTAINLTVSP